LRQMVTALRETGGGTVAVPEDGIVAALKKLAITGLFPEPTSASAAAALDELAQRGAIRSNERTVVVITGTGIKAASLITEILDH
jgi:threonine synthase